MFAALLASSQLASSAGGDVTPSLNTMSLNTMSLNNMSHMMEESS